MYLILLQFFFLANTNIDFYWKSFLIAWIIKKKEKLKTSILQEMNILNPFNWLEKVTLEHFDFWMLFVGFFLSWDKNLLEIFV